MNIILGDISHLSDILKIENECFERPWSEKLIREQLDLSNSVTFLCVEQGDFTGYISMSKVYDEIQIANIAVLPYFRKKGFGDALISRTKKLASEEGFSFITLEVRASNTPAIKLYEKHGFKAVGLRKKYYGDEDAVLMTLEMR